MARACNVVSVNYIPNPFSGAKASVASRAELNGLGMRQKMVVAGQTSSSVEAIKPKTERKSNDPPKRKYRIELGSATLGR
jgi:hypothetical protein